MTHTIEQAKTAIHLSQASFSESLDMEQKELLTKLIQNMIHYQTLINKEIDLKNETFQTGKWLMRAYGIDEAAKAFSNLIPKQTKPGPQHK